jgi:hypothetical protein
LLTLSPDAGRGRAAKDGISEAASLKTQNLNFARADGLGWPIRILILQLVSNLLEGLMELGKFMV